MGLLGVAVVFGGDAALAELLGKLLGDIGGDVAGVGGVGFLRYACAAFLDNEVAVGGDAGVVGVVLHQPVVPPEGGVGGDVVAE